MRERILIASNRLATALLLGAVVACSDRQGAASDSIGALDTAGAVPEGGGAASRVSRDALRDRSAWTVGGAQRRFPLAPPAGYSTLSTVVGRHFNCMEQELATRAADLASRPHVGVRLQPEGAQSCLQSWNATFVFDTVGGSPRLTAILYDQWEW